MSRYAVGLRSTGAGSTTLPVGSLWAAATVDFHLVEVGVFNSTTTACNVALRKFTTGQGTPGAALTEIPYDTDSLAASTTGLDTHTVTPTAIVGGFLAYASLGAAVGAGVIWTFGAGGIRVPKATTNGIGLIVGSGTGQILDWYMVWDE